MEIISEQTFLQKYCEKYQCQPEDFEKQVLWRCLYYSATAPLARIIFWVNPDYFLRDLSLIAEVKDLTNFSKLQDTIAGFEFRFMDESTLRRRFKIRLSRSKLISLGRSVFNRKEMETSPIESRRD